MHSSPPAQAERQKEERQKGGGEVSQMGRNAGWQKSWVICLSIGTVLLCVKSNGYELVQANEHVVQ